MRVVLDTNVLISALLQPKGNPGKILEAAVDGRLTIVSSPRLLQELEGALSYPHIQKRLLESWTEDDLRSFLLSFRNTVTEVSHEPPWKNWVPDDPDDDWVVACALAGKADYIVSGDQHLLALKQVDGIKIVSPAEFIKLVP